MPPAARRAGPVLIAGVGFGLLMMAGPRILAAIHLVPENAVLRRLDSGATVTPAALEGLASSRRAAAAATGSGRTHIERGRALHARALMAATAARRTAFLDRSIAALRRGLSRSPASGLGWLTLAQAWRDRWGPSPPVAHAIRMSIRTAPYDRRIMFDRLQVALAVWPQFDDAGRAAVARQARLAGRQDARRLAMLRDPAASPGLLRRLLDGGAPAGGRARR